MAITSNKWKDDELEHQGRLELESQKYGKVSYRRRFSQNPDEIAYLGTDERSIMKIVVIDNSEMVGRISKKVTELEAKIRILQEEYERARLNKLLEQNDVSRKELESIFNIGPNDDIDTLSLDGLLQDCVDPEQNSQELIRSVRDN